MPALVGLSDHDVAARARGADPGTLALIAAEAAHRDLLARLFPGGQLLGDSDVTDDELAWAMQYATGDELLGIGAEMDQRDGPRKAPPVPASRQATADSRAATVPADRTRPASSPAPGAPTQQGARPTSRRCPTGHRRRSPMPAPSSVTSTLPLETPRCRRVRLRQPRQP